MLRRVDIQYYVNLGHTVKTEYCINGRAIRGTKERKSEYCTMKYQIINLVESETLSLWLILFETETNLNTSH